jgi:crotonobetainyl-CoA:carnitine CoA-transferase CaiB-like acyl-CoA transferase
MAGPLEGLRVIDMSRVLAGPLCAKTLMDLGADVIKIEPPRADVSRFSMPTTVNGMSGYFAQQNAGKRNISLDLNLAEGRELAMRLCETADIVVENFRPGTLGYFGLDYERVSARNPKVIYVSISGYGQGGPWSGRMAYAPTVQAESGFTAHTHNHYAEALVEDRADSLSHADVYSGLQGAIGVLAALNQLHKSGKGQHIDVAMAATIMAINEHAHIDLGELDTRDEAAILGATDGSFFNGPSGERIIAAASLINTLTFRSIWPQCVAPTWLTTHASPHPALAAKTSRRCMHWCRPGCSRSPTWQRWMPSLTKPRLRLAKFAHSRL